MLDGKKRTIILPHYPCAIFARQSSSFGYDLIYEIDATFKETECAFTRINPGQEFDPKTTGGFVAFLQDGSEIRGSCFA